MGLVAKYRRHAERCRALAAQTRTLEFEQTLDAIAREWETIASQQEARLLEEIDRRISCWQALG